MTSFAARKKRQKEYSFAGEWEKRECGLFGLCTLQRSSNRQGLQSNRINLPVSLPRFLRRGAKDRKKERT